MVLNLSVSVSVKIPWASCWVEGIGEAFRCPPEAGRHKVGEKPSEIFGGAATGFYKEKVGAVELGLKVSEQLKLNEDLGC